MINRLQRRWRGNAACGAGRIFACGSFDTRTMQVPDRNMSALRAKSDRGWVPRHAPVSPSSLFLRYVNMSAVPPAGEMGQGQAPSRPDRPRRTTPQSKHLSQQPATTHRFTPTIIEGHCRARHTIDEVGFDPAGADPSVRLNTWRGWPMEPEYISASRLDERGWVLARASVFSGFSFFRYLKESANCCSNPSIILRNRNQEGDLTSRWLLQWMAWPLQNPGAKMLSALNHARACRNR
uniref:Uncharacterized protein n=1 Tax=Candidatus Kentrum eta TaxID=2126337 RepID=A0A450V2P6_9GAMM|nr:MAG: hypothetical protein BECKH772A_GA0070896_1014710 [Candidatus Kentron sp. H]VFJ99053.1 MAG: hypothetical protein BECKH772B_GA0070898_1014811 [Candidatus Kentron sp. H]VFK03797.1 MAG: hypothetical protein BECKH772C_GA0070978_1014511 [Candidatus Kentron sp. H]